MISAFKFFSIVFLNVLTYESSSLTSNLKLNHPKPMSPGAPFDVEQTGRV